VLDDDKCATWEIRIAADDGWTPADKEIVTKVRCVQVNGGDQFDLTKSSSATRVLGSGSVDGRIKLSFRKECGDNVVVKEEDLTNQKWWLPRLIRNGEARSLKNGAWRIRVPIGSANAVFDVKLSKGQLPEDWPKD
jgi:hypothetical protein